MGEKVEKLTLTEEEALKFLQYLNNGIFFREGIWVMEFYDRKGEKYQSQEIQGVTIRIFKDFERKKVDTGALSKPAFKENLVIECFDKNGFLKWAEKDGVDIPITRKDITAENWVKMKLKL